MLIARNLHSGKTDWWIMLELENGELHDLHHAGKPFVGTQWQVDMYADHLAEQALLQGLPLKEINIIPIKRAS